MVETLAVLKHMKVGNGVAEFDESLERYFVETVNARRGGFPEVRLPRRSQRALAVRVALLCMRGVRSPTTRHTMAPIAVAKKTAL